MSQQTKPFGLSFLTEVPADELAAINGGVHHKKHKHPGTGGGTSTGGGSGSGSTGGGTLHTMAISMATPALPQGDSF